MEDIFLAHSENTFGKFHELKVHLRGVEERMHAWAFTEKLRKSLALAALIHDLGKYLTGFQKYLCGNGASVPHARWGALLAKKLQSACVSFAIDGHHAGIPDYNKWDLQHTCVDDAIQSQLEALVHSFMVDMCLTDRQLLNLIARCEETDRERDIHTRYVFSCLTDADWLDTEEHFSPEKTALREHQSLDITTAINLIDAELSKLSATSSPINELRTHSRLEALTKASLPIGFYSLNLPTGLGKTLTSFRWALEHAKVNNLGRIIVVLPYTSIIDQTAKRLKNILGKNLVLEHHASYMPADDEKEREELCKLACENWDAPIILTTTVQFFETLFSNMPGKCRKFHNISNSVVILDEVQTLPKAIVLPTLDMLQDVQHFMRISFVFCTATMPTFEKSVSFPGIDNIIELAENPAALFKATQRVRYTLLDALRPVSSAQLHKALDSQQTSTLIITNTKRLALKLYTWVAINQEWDAVFHLSTSMCPHHRKKVIEEISKAVKDTSKKILVFSTQLVEAGVDLDFPCVFRELAPLESIIQAAGRCNREGRLFEGIVTLFRMEDGSYPDKFYRTQADVVSTLLSAEPDCLYTHETFQRYYNQIMSLYVEHSEITKQREKRNFSTAAAMYKIITNNTRPVFIWDYNDESRSIYNTLRVKGYGKLPLSRAEFRAMQQYSVQMYETDLFKSARSWEQAYGGLLIWNGDYNEHTGLSVLPDNADGIFI